MTAIGINSEISAMLTALGVRHYPILAPENTQMPVAVFTRAIDFDSSKDGYVVQAVTVDLAIYTNNYAESISLLDKILGKFAENKYLPVNITEDNADEIFVQNVIFSKELV